MAVEAELVSVIIKVFNGEKYIAESIVSVFEQTHSRLELIVVDDGSTDNTAREVNRFGDGLRYVYQKNMGIGHAMNTGIGLTSGRLIAFQDADDIWMPGKLEQQLSVFASDPEVDLVFGHVAQFISPDLATDEKQKRYLDAEAKPGYLSQTMLARRAAFDRVGLFDTGYQCGEFVDWYMRAQEAGLRIKMLEDVVLKRRIHSTNQGIVKKDARSDYARLLRTALDRRRGKPSSDSAS